MDAMDKMIDMSMKYASATGRLYGAVIGEMLYNDDIQIDKFNMLYETLNYVDETIGREMDPFDKARLEEKLEEIKNTKQKPLFIYYIGGAPYGVLPAYVRTEYGMYTCYNTTIVVIHRCWISGKKDLDVSSARK